jgi:hypothetical protein
MSRQRPQPTIRGLLLSISGVVVLLTAILVLITQPPATTLAWGLAGAALAAAGSVGLNAGAMSIQHVVDQRMQRRREQAVRPAGGGKESRQSSVLGRLREQEILAQLRALGRELLELLRGMPLEQLMQLAQRDLPQQDVPQQDVPQPERLEGLERLERLVHLQRLVELEPQLVHRFDKAGPDQKELGQLEQHELELLTLVRWLESELRAWLEPRLRAGLESEQLEWLKQWDRQEQGAQKRVVEVLLKRQALLRQLRDVHRGGWGWSSSSR